MTLGPARPKLGMWLALLAGLVVLGVYWRTLYPGLNGIGDTPKFQFLGKLLGTAHPPGYPLYTLLNWAFAQFPLGNLAWRINLLSALTMATAASLLVLVAGRLGAPPVVAFATGLAFGFGRVVWSQATLAEVYALAAAWLAALLLALVAWGESRHSRTLDAAVLLAALALAHHTTVALVAPALVAYVLATEARAGLRPAFLARAALLVMLGLLPYVYVLLRNWQGAPYLGARATSLAELLAVIRGASFEGRLFGFDLATLVTARVPLIARLVAREMTPVGVLFAGVGLLALARRSRPGALLFGLAALGLLGFAINYDVPDIEVFLIPAFVVLWPLAAVGMASLTSLLGRHVRVLAPMALALPAYLLAANYRASDHHDRSFEMRYFGALFEVLPARAAVASESYTVDHMVLYELFGEEAAGGRSIVTIPGDAESVDSALARGQSVFAFGKTAEALRAVGYRFTPLPLRDRPLDAHVASLPRGRIVIQAGRRDGAPYAAVGTAGRPLLSQRSGESVGLELPNGAAIGASQARAPVALAARSSLAGARIEVAGALAAESEDGVALAVLGPGGRVIEAHDLDPAAQLRVPFVSQAFPVLRLVGPPDCAAIGKGGWTDVGPHARAGRLLLRVDNHAPYAARIVVYLSGPAPFAPRLVRSQGVGVPELRVSQGMAQDDGFTGALPGRVTTRLELHVQDEGQFHAATLDLGDVPMAAWARADVDLKSERRALVCSLPPADAELFGFAERRESLPIGLGAFAGRGFYAPEREGFRWTSAREALLLLSFATPVDTRVRLRAMPRPGDAGELELLVNGAPQGSRALAEGWASYGWDVPATAWRSGTNLVVIRGPEPRPPSPSGGGLDQRPLGVAISSVRLDRR